jgi:hypothetical protein
MTTKNKTVGHIFATIDQRVHTPEIKTRDSSLITFYHILLMQGSGPYETVTKVDKALKEKLIQSEQDELLW